MRLPSRDGRRGPCSRDARYAPAGPASGVEAGRPECAPPEPLRHAGGHCPDRGQIIASLLRGHHQGGLARIEDLEASAKLQGKIDCCEPASGRGSSPCLYSREAGKFGRELAEACGMPLHFDRARA